MKLKDAIEVWKEYKMDFVKKSTWAAYSLLIQNHILPEWSERESVIEEHEIQDFVLKKIRGGLSQKTVKDVLIVLKMILKFTNKRDLFRYKEWDVVYPTNHEHKQMEVLTVAEHKQLIAYLKANFTFRNLGILITASTGMRIGEVCGLTWKDIDLERGVITVGKTVQRVYMQYPDGTRKTELIIDSPKTKSSNREIPMSKDLLYIVKPLKKIVPEHYYILTNEEKPTEPRTYRAYYRTVMQKLKLPDINFHALRHTFATRCINAKIDVKTVSVILGHSNISTTLNTYSHPNMEQKKSAIDHLFKTLK